MKKILLFTLCVLLLSTHNGFGQSTVMNPNDPVITYDPANPPAIPADGQIAPWVRTVRTGWNTDKFKAYYLSGMVYRIRFPNGYNPNDNTKKYPMILFLHGGGESAGIYDNEYQLFLEAQKFEALMDNGQWNGFLLFPQCASAQLWDYFHFDRISQILDNLTSNYHLDPDRVISTGLSMGGLGSIRYSAIYPKYSAVAIGSSPALIQTMTDEMLNNLVQIPVWVANGGLDTNPEAYIVENFVNSVTSRGGNVRHSFYPNDGHFVWDFVYDHPDLLSYFNYSHKANPVVYNGKIQYATNAPINSKMGITAGFAEYQWQRNNVDIPGASSNEYTATQLGSYRARFRRVAGGEWSDWSLIPAVISLKDAAPGPGNVNGVAYRYYEGVWSSLPDFSVLTPMKTGVTPNIDVSVRTQGRDDYYGFVWEGRITLPTTGQYTFEIASDDGSKFYFNTYYSPTAIATINNDGSHGDVPSVGVTMNVNAGTYPFALTYFEAWGGENMKLYWTLPNGSRELIPSSAFSNSSVPVDVTPPSVPANLVVTSKGASFVNLSWTASTDDVGVTRYDIFENGTSKYTTTVTTFNVTGLTASTNYSYAVKAFDATGNSSALSTAVAVVTDPPAGDVTPPSVPTSLQVTSKGATFVNLSWTASTDDVGVTRYDIFENGTSKYTTTGTTFNVTGLTASTNYSYAVKAFDAAGNSSSLSSAVAVVTDPPTGDVTPPSVPTGLQVTSKGTTFVNLSWTASTDDIAVTRYEIFENGSSKYSATGTTLNVTGLTSNTAYTYAVKAFDAAGNSSALGTAINVTTDQATTIDVTPPTVPTALQATSKGSTFINLLWTASTDNVAVTRYDIFENGSATSNYSTTGTTFSVPGLTPSTSYTYAVKAFDAAGNASALSTAITVVTDPASTTNGGLTYKYYEGDWNALPNYSTLTPIKTGSVANIDFSMRNVPDYYGVVWEAYLNIPTTGTYTFELASDDGSKMYFNSFYNFSATALVDNDGLHGDVPTASATIGNVTAGAHAFALAYFEKWGGDNMQIYWTGPGIPRQLIPASAFSQNPPPADGQAPSVPTGLAVTSTGTTFLNLDWDNATDNVGVTRYDIYENGSLKYTSTVSNYLVTGLTPNTTYTYAIRAADAAGNVSTLGTSITPKTTGSGSTSGLNYRYFEGDWDAVPNFNALTPVKIGTSPNIDLGVRRIEDYFGLVWEGYITLPTAGTYTFEIASDDGSKFYWNTLYNPATTPLINNDGLHGDVPGVSATLTNLAAGVYPISLAYFEKWGGQNMVLYWTGPNFAKQVVPNSAFTSSATQLTAVPTGIFSGNSESTLLMNDHASLSAIGNKLRITEAYPNPFVDKFTIEYSSPVSNSKVDIQVYDLNGRMIATKYFGNLPAGSTLLKMDVNGKLSPKSIYIAKVNVDGVPAKLLKLIRNSK